MSFVGDCFFPPLLGVAPPFFLRGSGAEMPHCLVPRAGTCDLTTMSGNQISFPFPLYLKKLYTFLFSLGQKSETSRGFFPPSSFIFYLFWRIRDAMDSRIKPRIPAFLDSEGGNRRRITHVRRGNGEE